MSSFASDLKTHTSQDQLIDLISQWIAPLGYRVIYLEVQPHRHKVLRIYIDFLNPVAGKAVGIEDCVKVSRALDEPLEQNPAVEAFLAGSYELEVSSPGVNRPLRSATDFEQFAGQRVRIHTFRSLTNEEVNNEDYYNKNPKQKNFLGILRGIQGGRVLLSIIWNKKLGQTSGLRKVKSNNKESLEGASEEDQLIMLPLPLISKANLEPEISIETKHDRE